MKQNIEKLKEQINAARNSVAKFQQGGIVTPGNTFNMRTAAKIAQSYRKNPNARFRKSYFLDDSYNKTYENDPSVSGSDVYVSQTNPGMDSEGMRVNNQATGQSFPFPNKQLDQMFAKPPVANNRPTMAPFMASKPMINKPALAYKKLGGYLERYGKSKNKG